LFVPFFSLSSSPFFSFLSHTHSLYYSIFIFLSFYLMTLHKDGQRQWVSLLTSFCLGMLAMVTIQSVLVPRTRSTVHQLVLSKRGADGPNNNGSLASTILQFGDPGTARDFLEREEYVVSYDRRNRVASWVGEHLTAASLVTGEGVNRDHSKFQEDPDVPALFRSKLADYTKSGYDRGHMAPAGDAVADQTAMDQTFYLSNMSPQVGIGFNRHCK
jgi:endonuclease G